MLKAGLGSSKNMDSFLAGKEAVNKALSQIGDVADFLLIFSSSKFNSQELIKGVREISKDTKLIGCTTAGEITTDGPEKNSVAILAIKGDGISFEIAAGGNLKDGAEKAGEILARNLKEQNSEINSIIMLTDVLCGNGADVVRGIQKIMGKDFLIVGGAAGDDFMFKETNEFCCDKVLSGYVVGAGLSGNFLKGVGVRHGWDTIGLPMKVTKSEGAVLKELDGKPAVSIYEDYFGKKAEELREEPLARMAITYPLGMVVEGSEELLIRDPISVDKNGWITCAAEIPEGSEVRLMIGSKDKAVEAAKDAAEHALDQLRGKKAKAVILFDCIARQKLFGRDANKEIEAIKAVFGENIPVIGFYTYGEQAPLGGDMEKCFSCFHNETAVIFALGDDGYAE